MSTVGKPPSPIKAIRHKVQISAGISPGVHEISTICLAQGFECGPFSQQAKNWSRQRLRWASQPAWVCSLAGARCLVLAGCWLLEFSTYLPTRIPLFFIQQPKGPARQPQKWPRPPRSRRSASSSLTVFSRLSLASSCAYQRQKNWTEKSRWEDDRRNGRLRGVGGVAMGGEMGRRRTRRRRR